MVTKAPFSSNFQKDWELLWTEIIGVMDVHQHYMINYSCISLSMWGLIDVLLTSQISETEQQSAPTEKFQASLYQSQRTAIADLTETSFTSKPNKYIITHMQIQLGLSGSPKNSQFKR